MGGLGIWQEYRWGKKHYLWLKKIARIECNKEALKDLIKENLNMDFIQSIFSPYNALVKRRINYYTSASTIVVLTALLKKIAIYSY